MRFRGLLLSLVAVLVFGAVAVAGPLRQWIHHHRPGLVVPKQHFAPVIPAPVDPAAHPCPCGPTCPCQPVCPCPGQAQPTDAEALFYAMPVGPIVVDSEPITVPIVPSPSPAPAIPAPAPKPAPAKPAPKPVCPT